jgi:large subunit ribosomal protein L32
MSVPKKRRTKSQRKRRASHFALKGTNMSKCSRCDKPVLSHRACSACGYYRGRQVLVVEAKELKRMEKEKAKREKEARKEEKSAKGKSASGGKDEKAKKVQI